MQGPVWYLYAVTRWSRGACGALAHGQDFQGQTVCAEVGLCRVAALLPRFAVLCCSSLRTQIIPFLSTTSLAPSTPWVHHAAG
jgi:hypothetical protein